MKKNHSSSKKINNLSVRFNKLLNQPIINQNYKGMTFQEAMEQMLKENIKK
ncbi:MAG: hypothetical protein OXC61_02295 [Flavobacteriaceae bacterium]|nr:hypothetical protein [Flavobacteriaceae bacterium]